MKNARIALVIALAMLLLASNAFGSIAFIPNARQANVSRNDTIGLQFQLKNTGEEQACIDLSTEQNDAYIDTSLVGKHFCLNAGESSNVTLTIRTINAQRGLNLVTLMANSGQGNANAIASLYVSEEPEIELVAYPSDLCRGGQESISVLVRNNSNEFKHVTLQAENELLLPYFARQEIDLMPSQQRYVDLVVNTSPYSAIGRHYVSLYAITSHETVKETISLDVEDCKEDNAEFSVSISGSCFTVEKGRDEKIYFKVKNLLGTEQKVFFSVGGGIKALLQTQSAWLEGNEQRQFYFTVNAGEEARVSDYNITLRAWNADHSVEKSICVKPKKAHITLAEVKENGLLVRQCESVVFTVLLRNAGDYYEDFKLSIDNAYGKVKATLSDESLRLEKHTERQVYISVTVLEGLPEGSYNITLNAKTSQGTIKKTLNFKVLPKQAGPEPQPEQALQVSGYPSSISMDANSEKTVFVLLKNGSGETLRNISLELTGLPAGVTAQPGKNIQLLPGKEMRFELVIAAGLESKGQYSVVLSAYNGTYSDEKQVSLSIQEQEGQAGTMEELTGLFVAGGSALLGIAILAVAIVAITLIAGALNPKAGKEIWMRG